MLTSKGATPAPLDLVDGDELLELVRDHLSDERAKLATSYRGFGQRQLSVARAVDDVDDDASAEPSEEAPDSADTTIGDEVSS